MAREYSPRSEAFVEEPGSVVVVGAEGASVLLLCEVLLLLWAPFDAGDTRVIFPFVVGGREGVWAWAMTVWVAVGLAACARVMCFFPGPHLPH